MGATIAFGSVVRKANRSFVVSPFLTFRTDVQRVQMPPKKTSGRLSSRGGRSPQEPVCGGASPAVQRAGTRLVFWPRLARPRSDRAGLRPAQDALGTAAARTIDPSPTSCQLFRQQTAPTPSSRGQ